MRRSPSHDNNYYTSIQYKCVCVCVLGTRRHEIIERFLRVSAGTRVAADRFFSFRFGFFPADQGPGLDRTRSQRTREKKIKKYDGARHDRHRHTINIFGFPSDARPLNGPIRSVFSA